MGLTYRNVLYVSILDLLNDYIQPQLRGELHVGCLLDMNHQLHAPCEWLGQSHFQPPKQVFQCLSVVQEDCTLAPSMLTTDVIIWQRIQNGDQIALKSVFDQHYKPLCRYAYQWTVDADEAEEIVQKLFVDLWQRRAETHIEITIRSYLFAAVRNRCLNYIKHQKVVVAHQKHMRLHTEKSHGINEISDVNAALDNAMELLPPQCRRIFEMVKLEGKRYAEISAELDISMKTIENHMTKALRVLRHEMRDYLPICIWLMYWLTNDWMN